MLRQDLNEALKKSMLAKDNQTVGAIRLIMAKLKDMDIAARPKGVTEGISDTEIQGMMQGMIKQRRESIEMYKKGNRADLVAQEQGEIDVIERFLPKQMNEAEMKAAIEKAIATTGAASIKDMGKVMGELKKNFTGQMDFAAASALIKGKLAG